MMTVFAFSSAAYAQESVPPAERNSSVSAGETPAQTDTDSGKKSAVRYGILFGEVPLITFFGAKAWNWSGDHSFYSKNEGWFGAGTDYGGQDKMGHGFAHYVLQRSMYQVFNWTENGGSMKWVYSLSTSMACGFLIEIGDGFSSKYGFSFQDLTIDYAGILLGAMLDRFPVLDGFVGFSAHWSPSDAYLERYKARSAFTDSLDFVNDYSAWKFMLNFKFAGFRNLGFNVPLALRILQLDVGYYTRGYSNYDKGKWARPHERDVFVGISVNSAQVIEETWGEYRDNSSYKVSHTFFEYYHVPLDAQHSFKL
jgi:hypothetical protein